jgi:hypothetical protein
MQQVISSHHRAQIEEVRSQSGWRAHLSVNETRMPAEDCGVVSSAFLGNTLSYIASATSADAPARSQIVSCYEVRPPSSVHGKFQAELS